jgi:hypothetical protein
MITLHKPWRSPHTLHALDPGDRDSYLAAHPYRLAQPREGTLRRRPIQAIAKAVKTEATFLHGI